MLTGARRNSGTCGGLRGQPRNQAKTKVIMVRGLQVFALASVVLAQSNDTDDENAFVSPSQDARLYS